MIAESGSAGLGFSGYYALPFTIPLRYLGEPTGWRVPATFAESWRRFGLKWDVAVEAGTFDATQKSGSTDLAPDRTSPVDKVSLLDPAYEAAAVSELTSAALAVAGKPYVSIYEGLDEPRNPAPRIPMHSWPAWLLAADRQVRRGYGYGRYAIPQPTSRAFTHSGVQPFSWIAYNRWVFDQYLAQRVRLRARLRSIDPRAVYDASDLKFVDGLPAFDFSRWGQAADVVEADPYYGLAERNAPGRGRYNAGFAAKFLSDLTGKPVRIIVQAFDHGRYSPTRSDFALWTSQALVGGADMISYYELDNPRFTRPDRYATLLSLASRLRRTTTKHQVPADRRTVVLWSFTSAAAKANWSTGDAVYSAYALLGPGNGARFRFVSDTQIERHERSLGSAKVVFLPQARYFPKSVAMAIRRWVRSGGTLVVGDPWAFEFDRNGAPLSGVRRQLLGSGLGKATGAHSVVIDGPHMMAASAGGLRGSAGNAASVIATSLAGRVLPISVLRDEDGRTRMPARKLSLSARDRKVTTVLATYGNRRPAVVWRGVGRGHVLYFAASPFTPKASLAGGWRRFMRWLLVRSRLAARDPRWGWRLSLPRTTAIRLALASKVIRGSAGGLASLRWRVSDRLRTSAAVTAVVRLGRTRTATLQFGWAPTNSWTTGSAPLALRPGRYAATLQAVDPAGNATSKGIPATIMVR